MSLRIAISVDPYLPVPPVEYGGIERIIDFLVRGLHARGHRVSLVAHPGSQTPARLIPYGAPPHVGWSNRIRELAQAGGALWQLRHEVDVVHSFGRLAALLPLLPIRTLPKVQSYQREVPWRSVDRALRLASGSLMLTGCTVAAVRRHSGAAVESAWRVVPNGVDLSVYTPQRTVPLDAPLMFLGRLDPIKGAHAAVAIAQQSRRRLVIAGTKVTEGPDPGYFDREIAPHVDGDRIQYVGPVRDAAKNALLGRAAALLMPIEWEEPFGIVMAEAMACGTPVIGFARGSVPEVVRDGVNGFVCRTVDEAAGAVARLSRIDRCAVRQDCEARFGADTIVDQYLALYGAMIERARRRRVA